MPEFENSRIEKLKRALYSRDQSLVPKENRGDIKREDLEVPSDWGTPPVFNTPPDIMVKKNNSFFNKFLTFSIIFFLLAVGVASFIFFGGFNMISSNNVDIKVAGSNIVASGEELDLNISILNQNRTNLENAVLYIEYPDGVSQVGEAKNLRTKFSVGVLNKGESRDYPLKVLVFGEKDSVKTIKLKMEYTVSGSNATFSKEKDYDISINSSPIIMEVSYPREVNSGQEVSISIDLTSNSNVPMLGTLVKIEYPYGFSYTDSSIKPSRDNSVWNIGDLKNGDKKTLVVKGVLVGQNMEDRSFRISAGVKSDDPSKDFETDLAVSQITLGIRKSFFDLTLKNISDSENNGMLISQSPQLSLSWKNTLPDKVINSNILVKISGNVFDKSRVSVNDGGLYKSIDNTIYWDKNSTDSLRDISPGENGSISFSLGTLSGQNIIRSVKNPHIDINVEMKGERTGLDSATISSSAQTTIKFNSTLGLISKSYRNTGLFSNTGPIPPRVDKETTYTINWAVTNTTNDLKDVYVRAILPVGVSWKSESSPSSEKITYDPDSNSVVWSLGNVSSGLGLSYAPREVSFKVSVVPNASQVGESMILVGSVNATGVDTYTESILRASAQYVSTVVSDPGFSSENGSVAK